MPSTNDRSLKSLLLVLTKAGATPNGAETIARRLLDSGLTTREARDWIQNPHLAYPHPQPPQDFGGVPVVLVAGTRWCVSNGREDIAIEGATAFATASESERTIAWLFNGNIPDVRTLTGSNPARAQVSAEVATLLLERLGTPRKVADIASTMLDDEHDRIRDQLRKGQEQAVLTELRNGTLDLDALLRSSWRDPTW